MMQVDSSKVRVVETVSPGLPVDIVLLEGEKCLGFYKVVAEPDAAIIYYMYIKPEARGRGLGKTILDRVKRDAKCIKTQVAASTKDSLRFLRKQGFRKVHGEMVWTKPTTESDTTLKP